MNLSHVNKKLNTYLPFWLVLIIFMPTYYFLASDKHTALEGNALLLGFYVLGVVVRYLKRAK